MEEIMNEVSVLWNYLCLDKKQTKKGECIIGLGSILKIVPKKCAELYKQKLGEYIVFSGNCGKGTEGIIEKTEAEIFKNIAIEENVPEKSIFIEPDATTTYENFKYIKRVLVNNNLKPKSFLIVGKPYQERRALSIADVELSDKKYEIASHNITLEDYLEIVEKDENMKVEDFINELIGEISLLMLAPKYNLESVQIIPDSVMQSYKKIVAAGYNKYVYQDEMLKEYVENLNKKIMNVSKK